MPRTTCTMRSLAHSSSGSSQGRSRNVGWPGRANSWNAGMPAPALLHGACQQALGEVALEGKEHGERDRQRQERRRGDQLDVRPELAQLGEDRDLGRAVDARRFEDVLRQAYEEVT